MNTHIWVIDRDGLPYILEAPVASLNGNPPHHSNLANEAFVGGEIWFVDDTSIIISGGCGRFPPSGPDQLDSVVEVFEAFGFSTESLGWDEQSGSANRFYDPPGGEVP